MRMGQHMKLAPRMIQSMEILQMSILQLEERIAQELESNVTLESIEQGDSGSSESVSESDSTMIDGVGRAALDARDDFDAQSAVDRPLELDSTNGADDFSRLDAYEHDVPESAEHAYEPPAAQGPTTDFDDRRRTRSGDEFDAKADAINNTASRSASIQEQLREQWALSDVDDELRSLGEAIIGYIEDDGFLRTPLETIADRLPAEHATVNAGVGAGSATGLSSKSVSSGHGNAKANGHIDAQANGRANGQAHRSPQGQSNSAQPATPAYDRLERALRAVQLLLEPPGVAARDTRECLLLQIDAKSAERRSQDDQAEIWPLVRTLVDEHLDDLAQNRLPKIAEKSGESIDRIKLAMEKMRHLSLAPGRVLVEEPTSAIVPDAIVEYDADQDRYIVYLNDRRLPNLRINREYAMMAKDREAPKPTREFIKKNLSNASWLIDAVEQRKRTLERVIRVVVDAQRDYFDYGPAALKPLPMTQVAEQLGVHVATVSRAVADKHLLTPRGTVALRGFFSGGTQTQSGEDMSWDAVKAAMQEVVDAEDKKAPLSDDAIAEELKNRGIEIARRTVAKYRDQLEIPAARLRRAY